MANTNDTDRNGWQIANQHVQQHDLGSDTRTAVEALIRDLDTAGIFRDASREQIRRADADRVQAELADAIALHQPRVEAVQG